MHADATELYEQGNRYANQGDMVRAEQYVSSAMARGYPARQALLLLIRICVAESRLGAAMKYAEPYLRKNPGDWRLRFIVSSVLLALDRPEEARTELVRVLKDAPDYAPSHYLLGVIYRDEYNDKFSAFNHFSKYLEIQPKGRHSAEVRSWLRDFNQSSVEPSPQYPEVPREHYMEMTL